MTEDTSRQWAQTMWFMLADGGNWGVPRCGLIYRKDEAGRRLILEGRMPWEEGMLEKAEDLRRAQDHDHEGITRMMALIDVVVVDETKEALPRPGSGLGRV